MNVDPLAALASLGDLLKVSGSSESVAPQPLPVLPAYARQPVDVDEFNGPRGNLYWRERSAGRAALDDELKRLMELEFALEAAREGRLHPDWREQGLAAAIEAMVRGRHGHGVWVWVKIKEQNPQMWEPKVLAAWAAAGHGSWRMALHSWRGQLLSVKMSQQLIDPQAVSRWAGFNLVQASMGGGLSGHWETVLDRHEGPWPTTLGDCHERWSESMRAHHLLQELDRIELSYDLGLAAGGEAIDWRGRHAQRIQRWRVAGERERELAHVERVSANLGLCRLPKAWLVAADG